MPLVLLWYELTVFCRLQKSTVPQHCSATKVVGAVVAWRVLIEPTRRFTLRRALAVLYVLYRYGNPCTGNTHRTEALR